MLLWFMLAAVCGVVGACNTSSSTFVSKEKCLLKTLMSDYDRRVRPVISYNDTLTVRMNLYIAKIIRLDEKTQTLEVNCWLRMMWQDKQLSWNPNDYGDVDSVRVPISELWTPDIVLFNAAGAVEYRNILAIVYYDGNVTWVPHTEVRVHCPLDLTIFPFDRQVCQLLFGSWTYSLHELYITGVSNTKYEMDSKEFTIESMSSISRILIHIDSKPYSTIQYTVTLKRVSYYHCNLFVGPGVLLALLVVFQFLLPVQAEARLLIVASVIICCTLLLILLEAYMPTDTQTMPVVGVYLLYTMTMATLSVILSSLVLSLYQRNQSSKQVPAWAKMMFLKKLGGLLCVSNSGYSSLPTADYSTSGATELLRFTDQTPDENNIKEDVNRNPTATMQQTLQDIRRYLALLANQSSHPSHQQLVIQEWQQLALVVNRLIFFTYCIITLLVTIVLFSHD